MNEFLISIITPSHNSSNYIADTIQSVLAQTYSNWEMIIVDDCSSDDTVAVINYFSNKDSRIRFIQLSKNLGAAVARNTAINNVNGRYIAFLDSDDLWLSNKLEKQIYFMHKNSVAFSYTAYVKVDESGLEIGQIDVPIRTSYNELLKTCVIGCLTAVYDTEYFGKVEMPLIRKRQDFGLWLKLLKKVDFAYGIQQPLAQYRVRKDSISSNKFRAITYNWKLYREVEGLNIIKSIYYFTHYVVRGFIRTKLPRLSRFLGLL